jgi:hypothetical protein
MLSTKNRPLFLKPVPDATYDFSAGSKLSAMAGFSRRFLLSSGEIVYLIIPVAFRIG